MRRAMITLLLAGLCACGTVNSPALGSSAPRIIYLSPAGNDAHQGGRDCPMRTLSAVSAKLKREAPDADVEVRCISNQGTYWNQFATWDYWNSAHTTTITSYPSDSLVHFQMNDSAASAEPFFRLSAAANDSTKLIFRRLAISGYNAGAIWFAGNETEDGWNGGNVIEDCVFDSIGNYDIPAAQLCYGMLDFVNSRGNTIRRCRLSDSDNSPWTLRPGGGTYYLPMLGVYLAHNSCKNQIYGNTFWDIKGDGIRIRDRSNENAIHHNIFEKTGYHAAVTTWYCHSDYDTCVYLECPSYGNTFFENTLTGNAYCGLAIATGDLREVLRSGCADEGARLSAWSNSLDTCLYHAALHDTGGIE